MAPTRDALEGSVDTPARTILRQRHQRALQPSTVHDGEAIDELTF